MTILHNPNKKKALFIGGTGTISIGITRMLAKDDRWELTLLNRGNHIDEIPDHVNLLKGDCNDEKAVAELIKDKTFDCVADFTCFVPEQVERDIRLFRGKTRQYILISTCAAYCTPPPHPWITEGMIQYNPYSPYAQNKIECEKVLINAFREIGFPMTIVRPSHTYSERLLPFCLESPHAGSWPVIKRMIEGKPIIVPGDGSSLWHITYNEDLAKGFIGLMGNDHAIGEAVHITNDEVITWDQMAKTVADELGVPYKPYYIATDAIVSVAPGLEAALNGDKRHSVIYDNTKLKTLVPGYCATTSWKEGVSLALSYIRMHPEYMQEDPEFDDWCDQLIKIYEEADQKARNSLPSIFG